MRNQLSFTTVPEARRRLLRSQFCGVCGKLLVRDEADARSYLGLLLRRTDLHPGAFALNVYRCSVQPGWHVGRSARVLALDFKAGRVIPPKAVAHAR